MSKNHVYAYEAGYRDGSVHYELEHCPACKNVADLQEALEENAALRQQLADVTESTGRVEERCAKLREYVTKLEQECHRLDSDNCDLLNDMRDMQLVIDESHKLRELVKELWEGYQDPPCDGCQLKGKPACADCPICAREAAVIDRMRELGIEVDE